MKRKLFFPFLFIFLIFTSCHKKNNIILDNENTIRNQVLLKEKNIYWTEELESEILQKEISVNQYLSSSVPVSIPLLNSVKNLKKRVLPQIEEIGSLDLESMDNQLVTFTKNLCSYIKNDNKIKIKASFDSNYVFNYVFFEEQLDNILSKEFNLKKGKSTFSKYNIGLALDSFDLKEVPVRFYNEEGFIDLKLFISDNEKTINVKQIEISRWGKSYGK